MSNKPEDSKGKSTNRTQERVDRGASERGNSSAQRGAEESMPPPAPQEGIRPELLRKLNILTALRSMNAYQMGESSKEKVNLALLGPNGSEVRIGNQRLTLAKIRRGASDILEYLLPMIGPENVHGPLLKFYESQDPNDLPPKGTVKRSNPVAKVVSNYVLISIIAGVDPNVRESIVAKKSPKNPEQVIYELSPTIQRTDKRFAAFEYVTGQHFKREGVPAVQDFKSRVQALLVPIKPGGLTPEMLSVKRTYQPRFMQISERIRAINAEKAELLAEEQDLRARMESQFKKIDPNYTLKTTSSHTVNQMLGFGDGAAAQEVDAGASLFNSSGFGDYDDEDGDLNE